MIGCLVLKFGTHQQHGGLGTGFPRVIFALSDTSATKETGVCTEGSKLKVSHHEVSPLLAMSRRSATGWLPSEGGLAVNGGPLAGSDPQRTRWTQRPKNSQRSLRTTPKPERYRYWAGGPT